MKQVVEKNEKTNTSRNVKENSSGYFGSLFGEAQNPQTNEIKPKKSSRFDFIKDV